MLELGATRHRSRPGAGRAAPMSAKVPQAAHADGLRELPPARSSAGSPCLETRGRLKARTDGRTGGQMDGWMEEP